MKSKMAKIGLSIVLYAVIYLICTGIFIGLFHTSLFKSMDVLMYRGILFIILTGILAAIIMLLACKKIKVLSLEGKDVFLMFCGYCCLNMVLFTLIPVTVERSVSVFMLSYMEQSEGQTFTEDEMSQIFVDVYVDGYGAFEKRFNEQVVSGNIEQAEDGGYRITSRGEFVVKMFRVMADWFDTDKRLVYPETE